MGARIGLIAEQPDHTRQLRALLEAAGYQVVLATEPRLLDGDQLAACHPDAWVVTCSEDEADQLDSVLAQVDAPVLFGDAVPENRDSADFQRWSERLLDKLQYLAVAGSLEAGDALPEGGDEYPEDTTPPAHVWVLAASLGGPAAVRDFLATLPAGLDVAFVYAQHIDRQFEPVLARSLAGTPFRVRVISHGHRLRRGQVSIVPVSNEVSFLPNGEVVLGRRGWSGPFTPSLDQVIAEVGRAFREQAGTIVFTGMSNDGQLGARIMHNAGGAVWVQRPETCLNASMPTAVTATGCVSRMGSPEELARTLASVISAQEE